MYYYYIGVLGAGVRGLLAGPPAASIVIISHIYIYIYVSLSLYIYIYMYIYIYICTYLYVYLDVLLCSLLHLSSRSRSPWTPGSRLMQLLLLHCYVFNHTNNYVFLQLSQLLLRNDYH